MSFSSPNSPPPPAPVKDPNEDEQRRRLALLRRLQAGRGATLLTGGLSADTPAQTQTVLGG